MKPHERGRPMIRHGLVKLCIIVVVALVVQLTSYAVVASACNGLMTITHVAGKAVQPPKDKLSGFGEFNHGFGGPGGHYVNVTIWVDGQPIHTEYGHYPSQSYAGWMFENMEVAHLTKHTLGVAGQCETCGVVDSFYKEYICSGM